MKHQLDGETLEQARTTRDFMAMAVLPTLVEADLLPNTALIGAHKESYVATRAYQYADAMMAARAAADKLARSDTPIVDASYATGTRIWGYGKTPTHPQTIDIKTIDIETARNWERSGKAVRPA